MNRKVIGATICAAAITGALHAQTTVAGVAGGPDKNVAFQYFVNSDPAGLATIRVDTLSAKAVTGKPFSATEVRRTRQTLGDGTHIDKVDKDKYYRDFDGRVRIERENGGGISVSDPTTGSTRETLMNGKSRVMMSRSGNFTATTSALGPDKVIGMAAPAAELQLHKEMLETKVRAEAEVAGFAAPRVAIASAEGGFTRVAAGQLVTGDKAATEDLGDQVINGVVARGTRTTITIPEGQIGNDREIKVVSERWFSNDLGLLIKSSNNDPRFGETTFELVDILQGAQDPTLFQMPAAPVLKQINH